MTESSQCPPKQRYQRSCSLCEKKIENYSVEFNHLDIDEDHAVDICRECLDKIFKWQQSIYAKLIPTKLMKNMTRKEKSKGAR